MRKPALAVLGHLVASPLYRAALPKLLGSLQSLPGARQPVDAACSQQQDRELRALGPEPPGSPPERKAER
mgnify:CR=1 FL=1